MGENPGESPQLLDSTATSSQTVESGDPPKSFDPGQFWTSKTFGHMDLTWDDLEKSQEPSSFKKAKNYLSLKEAERAVKRINAKRKLRFQREGHRKSEPEICVFYMKGICSKESGLCEFSHKARPPRRMELCKFYFTGCNLGAKCLFLHKEFPCKNLHKAGECKYGEKCLFSHEKLTQQTRLLLEKID